MHSVGKLFGVPGDTLDEVVANFEAENARREDLNALQQELRDEIISTQKAFKELENTTNRQATRIFNQDWGGMQDSPLHSDIVKGDKGALSVGPNWIGPVIDQMTVSLIGENGIKGAVNPKNPAHLVYSYGMTQYLSDILDENGWREMLQTAVVHIGTTRRAIFKTNWAKVHRARPMTGPIVGLVRPQRFWFDLEALQKKDCAFMVELVLYSEREFRDKYATADCGCTSQLSLDQMRMVQARVVPEMYSSHAYLPAGLRQMERRILVYEHYDLVSGRVTHMLARAGTNDDAVPGEIIWMSQEPARCPYVIVTLGSNGVDARGISDAVNIIRQQNNLDYISDRLMLAAQANKSTLWVDGRYVDKDTQFVISNTEDAEVIAIGINDENRQVTLSQIAMPAPRVQAPTELWALSDKVEKDLGITVAWAEMQQGRASGFRSASEAQLAEAHLRGRVVNKAGSFNSGLAEVMQQVCWLIGEFSDIDVIQMQVANTGNPAQDILKIPIDMFRQPLLIKVDSYNPVTSNPYVVAAQLQQWMPTFQQLPDMDWRIFAENLIAILGWPNFLKPRAQVAVEQQQAAAAQAAQMQQMQQMQEAQMQQMQGGGQMPEMPAGGGGAPPALPVPQLPELA